MTDKNIERLVQSAEELLSEKFSDAISLEDPERLDSQHLVIRCQVEKAKGDLPTSVILKQVTTTKFNQPDSESAESQRFLNEWATLDFLKNNTDDENIGARLLASHREESFIVLEDLGDHVSVLDVLRSDDLAEAEKALVELGGLLGRMHTATMGKENIFLETQFGLGTKSPVSDSTINFTERLETYSGLPENVGVRADDFEQAVVEFQAEIHHPENRFRTFIHADAGPHNFVWFNGQTRLLDFEFGAYDFGLLDVVSARLGFPHAFDSRPVPLFFVEKLERAYQSELAQALPDVEDAQVFRQAIFEACQHWFLSRAGSFWDYYFRECIEKGEASINKRLGITKERAEIGRAKVFMLVQQYAAFGEQFEPNPIYEVGVGLKKLFQDLWPEIDSPDEYNAFVDVNN